MDAMPQVIFSLTVFAVLPSMFCQGTGEWSQIAVDGYETAGWVDPHDMGVVIDAVPKPRARVVEGEQNDDETCVCPNSDTVSDNTKSVEQPFLSRHINMVVNKFGIDSRPDGITVRTTIRLDVDDVAALLTYVALSGEENLAKKLHALHGVDTALAKMFDSFEHVDEYGEVVDSFKESLSSLVPSADTMLIALPVAVTISLTLLLWRGMALWKVAIMLFVVSCAWEWVCMYKKVVADRHRTLIMQERSNGLCSNMGTSFFAALYKNFVYNEDKECLRYQEALLVDAALEVTPAMAVSETITKMLLHPLAPLGTGLGRFYRGVLDEHGYLASIGISVLAFLTLSTLSVMIFRYKISLPFFLGAIEPHTGRQQVENSAILSEQIESLAKEIKEKLVITNQPLALASHQANSVEEVSPESVKNGEREADSESENILAGKVIDLESESTGEPVESEKIESENKPQVVPDVVTNFDDKSEEKVPGESASTKVAEHSTDVGSDSDNDFEKVPGDEVPE